MIKHLLYFISFLSVCFSSAATVVDCKPGELAKLIDNEGDITSLTVNGSMNVVDFDFIADHLTGLKTLIINADIEAYKGEVTRNGSGVAAAKTLPPYALFGTNITEFNLNGSTTSLGEAALAGSKIEKLTVGSNITLLPDYLAKDVVTLREVELAESVTEIGKGAFDGCVKLNKVTAPAVSVIGDEAFRGCTALASFSFPSTLTSLGDRAFANSGLTKVDLRESEGLKNVGKAAFAECSQLANVMLPEGLTVLPEALLFAANSLTSLYIPETVETVEDYSLAGLTSLNPDDHDGLLANTAITTIGDYGMANWSLAASITLPASLNYLGNNAMQRWSSLETVNIPEEMGMVPELGENVWANTPQSSTKLNVYAFNLASQFSTTPQWKEFVITGLSSNESLADDEVAGLTLVANFVGDELSLHCSEAMVIVTLYDITGHTLARVTPNSTEATVSTTGMDNSLLLLVVNTETNKIISKKIIRK